MLTSVKYKKITFTSRSTSIHLRHEREKHIVYERLESNQIE